MKTIMPLFSSHFARFNLPMMPFEQQKLPDLPAIFAVWFYMKKVN